MDKDTLDKEMSFRFYVKRWNTYESYKIKRTIDGWEIRNRKDSEFLKSNKDGEGAIFNILEKEEIFFQKDPISYAFELLWNQANDGKIDFRELQFRMYELTCWISDMERYVRRAQPVWSKFY